MSLNSAMSKTLTNTILIPASDGLAAINPLHDTTVVDDVKKYSTNIEKREPVKNNSFWVRINQGGKSADVGYCETVTGLLIKRDVEAKNVGGNSDYHVKLPGNLSYSEVEFTNVLSNNGLFLEWVINGVNDGGIQKADIEICVGTPDDHIVYTLRDAFPISWSLGAMSVNVEGAVVKGENAVNYTFKNNQVPMDSLKVVYSRLDYKVENS